jgi:hypothetical protein
MPDEEIIYRFQLSRTLPAGTDIASMIALNRLRLVQAIGRSAELLGLDSAWRDFAERHGEFSVPCKKRSPGGNDGFPRLRHCGRGRFNFLTKRDNDNKLGEEQRITA